EVTAKVAVIVGAEQVATTVVDDVPVTEVDARRLAKPALREEHMAKQGHEAQGRTGPPDAPPVRAAHVRQADHVRGTTDELGLAFWEGWMTVRRSIHMVLGGKKNPAQPAKKKNSEQHEEDHTATREVLPTKRRRHQRFNGVSEQISMNEGKDPDRPDDGGSER